MAAPVKPITKPQGHVDAGGVVSRKPAGGVGGGVISKRSPAISAFVGRMVAEGRTPKGKR